MSKNKVIKSVGFNITNEDDQIILKAVKRRNFSRYVKKLLLQDIKAREEEKQRTEEITMNGKPIKKVDNNNTLPPKKFF